MASHSANFPPSSLVSRLPPTSPMALAAKPRLMVAEEKAPYMKMLIIVTMRLSTMEQSAPVAVARF